MRGLLRFGVCVCVCDSAVKPLADPSVMSMSSKRLQRRRRRLAASRLSPQVVAALGEKCEFLVVVCHRN